MLTYVDETNTLYMYIIVNQSQEVVLQQNEVYELMKQQSRRGGGSVALEINTVAHNSPAIEDEDQYESVQ